MRIGFIGLGNMGSGMAANLLSAGHDKLVDAATHPRIVSRLKQGKLAFYEEAQHEIMMEADPIRRRFWADFDTFVAGVAAR